MDIRNIKYSKFDIQIFYKKAHIAFCLYDMLNQQSKCNADRYKTKTQYLNVNLDRFLILDIRYLTFAVKLATYWIFKTLDIRNLIFRYW